jgi:plasmid stabilization system protein ParE
MKILIQPEADADLDAIYEWIAKDNPRAAVEMIRRIRAKLDLLATTGFAEIGRPGRDAGTRELVVAPYIIVYEFHTKKEMRSWEIVVLGIFHGATNR